MANSSAQANISDIHVIKTQDTSDALMLHCSFCGSEKAKVGSLYSGVNALICDHCLIAGARHVETGSELFEFSHAQELVNTVYKPWKTSELVSYERNYRYTIPAYIAVALKNTLRGRLRYAASVSGPSDAIESALTFSTFIQAGGERHLFSPLNIINDQPNNQADLGVVLRSAWLLTERNLPLLMLVTVWIQPSGLANVTTEVTIPKGPVSEGIVYQLFSTLDVELHKGTVFKGRQISIIDDRNLNCTRIVAETPKPIEKSSVILEKSIAWAIEDGLVGFIRNRESLRIMGYPAKRSVLIHGKSGCGKTYLSQYLLRCFPQCSGFVLKASQAQDIQTLFEMAKVYQPAIIVIDDVDLYTTAAGVAAENSRVKKLLTFFDEIPAQDNVLLIMTAADTNCLARYGLLRAGYIDQAIELVLPAAAQRRELITLYGKNLNMHQKIVDELVRRSDQFSPAAIKELVRRLAFSAVRAQNGVQVRAEHIDLVFTDILQSTRSGKHALEDFLASSALAEGIETHQDNNISEKIG